MGSAPASGAAIWLMKNATPEDIKVGMIGTVGLFGLIGLGIMGSIAYQAAAPDSETNSMPIRVAVAVQDCVQGKPTSLDSGFWKRYNQVNASVMTDPPFVKSGSDKITLAWISGQQNLRTVTENYGEQPVLRDYVETAILAKNSVQNGIQSDYRDHFKIGKSSFDEEHRVGFTPETQITDAARPKFEAFKKCAERYWFPQPKT